MVRSEWMKRLKLLQGSHIVVPYTGLLQGDDVWCFTCHFKNKLHILNLMLNFMVNVVLLIFDEN